jgi:ketosteroid isomerase-like protein
MSDEALLIELAHAIAAAIGRRDAGLLAGVLAPAFTHRGDEGVTADAAAFLEAIRGIPGEIVFVRLERVDADISGDAALLTGIQHARLTLDGQTVDDRRAFADFFVKSDGGWKLRAAADFPASPA